MFSINRFPGDDTEDVGDFLDVVMLSFMTQEIHYRGADQKEKARLLFSKSTGTLEEVSRES